MTRVRAAIFVGLMLVGSPVLGPAAAAAPAQCGAPDEAPGFETPAQRRVIPDVVCMDLQLAQDKAQAAEICRVTAQDATGRRRQFIDRNWTVTDQTPTPGDTYPKNTRVTLRVVKDREPSPC